MKKLRRFSLALALAAAFAIPAMAGETQGPGCANPGETQTPPGETQAPPCIANRDGDDPELTTQSAAGALEDVSTSTTMDVVFYLLETVF